MYINPCATIQTFCGAGINFKGEVIKMDIDDLAEEIVQVLEIHFGNFSEPALAEKLVREALEDSPIVLEKTDE